MKIFKVTPKKEDFLDMKSDGKKSIIYVRASDENMVEQLLEYWQQSANLPEEKGKTLEHSFTREKLNIEELTGLEISLQGFEEKGDADILAAEEWDGKTRVKTRREFIHNLLIAFIKCPMSWIITLLFSSIYIFEDCISKNISQNWQIWGSLLLSFFILLGFNIGFPKMHSIKKKDLFYISMIFCIIMFFVLSSPIEDNKQSQYVKHILDSVTAFGPIIVAFIACGISLKQEEIQEKQHNLALFKERWEVRNELDKIWRANFSDDYYYTFLALSSIIDKSKYLYNDSIRKKIEEIKVSYIRIKGSDETIAYFRNNNQEAIAKEKEKRLPGLKKRYHAKFRLLLKDMSDFLMESKF